MSQIKELLDKNKSWADSVTARDPEFFQKLSKQQSPKYLWIGCSDSRVPANQIVGLMPGEIFVHRNVANMVIHTDFNCLSVMHFAVSVLKVKHIIVCGHYGCGGVSAAMGSMQLGIVDNWLRHIKDVYSKYEEQILAIENQEQRMHRLTELNVIEQVYNVCHTTVAQEAWSHGQELAVHGWIYGINNGIINDLNVCVTKQSEVAEIYRMARSSIAK